MPLYLVHPKNRVNASSINKRQIASVYMLKCVMQTEEEKNRSHSIYRKAKKRNEIFSKFNFWQYSGMEAMEGRLIKLIWIQRVLFEKFK